MPRMLLAPSHSPVHLVACGVPVCATWDLLSWRIHSRGRRVIAIPAGELGTLMTGIGRACCQHPERRHRPAGGLPCCR
jgi:hypothetical protein